MYDTYIVHFFIPITIFIYIRFQKIPIHLESFEHIHIYILTQMHFSQIQVVPEKSLYENLNKQL